MGDLYDATQSKRGENPKRNKEGYLDLTAYKAIKKADASLEHERFHEILDILHSVCDENDFCIIEHIVLKDKRTGRIWK